jgi:hypothetical protein
MLTYKADPEFLIGINKCKAMIIPEAQKGV